MSFNKQKIKFLGHFISPQGMVMDIDKVKVLQDFPEPRNKRDLQSFSVSVIFIANFPKITLHFYTLSLSLT